jgi:ribosomal protein S18 acetylase RimI-like enzyme
MNEITLKLAEKQDAPVIFEFLQRLAGRLGKEDSFKGSVEAIEKFGFCERPAFEAILAFRQQNAVGCILFFEEFSTWRCSPGTYIQDLYVDASMRGQGLGKVLVNAAIEHSKRWQASYLRLSVDADNSSGLGFYTAIGFKHEHKENMLTLNISDLHFK